MALSLETLPKVLMTRQGWVLLGTGQGLVRKGLWGAGVRIHRAQCTEEGEEACGQGDLAPGWVLG